MTSRSICRPCPRPGLRRSEFSHSRNGHGMEVRKGPYFADVEISPMRVTCTSPARQRPPNIVSVSVGSSATIAFCRWVRPNSGRDRCSMPANSILRWSVGYRRRCPQIQRSCALQPGHGDEWVFRHRHAYTIIGTDRSSGAAGHHYWTDRSVRRNRSVGRRRHQPVHVFHEICAIR